MRHLVPVALVGLAALAFAPEAAAQLKPPPNRPAPKSGGFKGGFDSGLKRDRRDRRGGDDQPDAPRVPEMRLRWIAPGDRVRGRELGPGDSHVLQMEVVAGTRLTVRAAPTDRTTHLDVELLADGAVPVFLLDAPPGDPAARVLEDYVVGTTGVIGLRVKLGSNETGGYVLETAAEYPGPIEERLAMKGGRPQEIRFGGMEGRSIERLEVKTLDRSGVRPAIVLTDPDGVAVDLGDRLWTSSDASHLVLRELPLRVNGDYRLQIGDRARADGAVRVDVRFANPPPGRETHQL